MNKYILKIFFYTVILISPAYLIRFEIAGSHANVLDSFVLIFLVFYFYIYGTKFLFYKKFGFSFWFGISAVFLGVIFSAIFNNTYSISLGIFISWLLLPVLFAFAGTSLLKTEKDLYLFFLTLYFSVFSIALISLVYKFFGILTFDGRLQGFYSSPNFLAMQIVPGIIWGILIYIKKYYKSSIPKKLLFISTFSALLLTLFFTYSYGAWVAFFMAMLTIYFYNHYKFNTGFKINILSGTLIIIAIFLLSQAYSPRVISYFSNNPRTSLESRIMIWKSAALMISNNPIIGIGAGNFQKIYLENQKYFPLYLEWAVPQPHNIFLAFWLQSGLLGLIGFITLLVRTLNKLYFWQKKEHRNAFVIALSIYFLYFLFHGMLDTPFWKNDLALIFWLLLFVSFTPILVSEKNHP